MDAGVLAAEVVAIKTYSSLTIGLPRAINSSLVSTIPAHRALWKRLYSLAITLVEVGSGAFSDIVSASAYWPPERKFLRPFRNVFVVHANA